MDEIEWWEFASPAEMAKQVAGDVGFVIERAIEAHGGARIAIPGGQTPDLIYAALIANQAIDWSKVIEGAPSGRAFHYIEPFASKQMIKNQEITNLFA